MDDIAFARNYDKLIKSQKFDEVMKDATKGASTTRAPLTDAIISSSQAEDAYGPYYTPLEREWPRIKKASRPLQLDGMANAPHSARPIWEDLKSPALSTVAFTLSPSKIDRSLVPRAVPFGLQLLLKVGATLTNRL
ncbi:hypothetical protein NLU13_7108 [Sarocladium strictum]|uniref:Uncharacterized protein n=1 Tax=Sarocladium strictum TaxID=5046 RepID=A0AA39GFY2_SARSR|nr:hypothetical protein NLU13_7108 [Sarocladium strictum]